jgi:hypothetical protein
MTILIGQQSYVEFAGVALISDARKFDDGLMYDTTEASAGGSSIRRFRVTLLKAEPKMSVILDDDAAGQTIRAVLKLGQTGSLIWGPQGNSAGQPKYGITAQVSKANTPNEYDKEQEIEVEWINTADDMLFNYDLNPVHTF